MPEQVSKRAFLRGQFQERSHIRPPGAEAQVSELCTRCGKCAEACPTNILFYDNNGLPAVEFGQTVEPAMGPCLFCSGCADVCEPGAIRPASAWAVRASILPSCLSYNGVACRACEDHCDRRAIRFHLMTGGRSVPEIEPDLCTGCGACAPSCPSRSITFNEPTTSRG